MRLKQKLNPAFLWQLIPGLILLALPSSVPLAQNGVAFDRTLTFADTFAEADDSASLRFDVSGYKSSGRVTIVWFELGPDDPTLSFDIEPSFVLSLNDEDGNPNPEVIDLGTEMLGLFTYIYTYTNTDGETISLELVKNVRVVRWQPDSFPRLYQLRITHVQGVPEDHVESWELTIKNLQQTDASLTRGIAFVEQGTMEGVEPVGPSGGEEGENVYATIAAPEEEVPEDEPIVFTATLHNADDDVPYSYCWYPEDSVSRDISPGAWDWEVREGNPNELAFNGPKKIASDCCIQVTFRLEVWEDQDGNPATCDEDGTLLTQTRGTYLLVNEECVAGETGDSEDEDPEEEDPNEEDPNEEDPNGTSGRKTFRKYYETKIYDPSIPHETAKGRSAKIITSEKISGESDKEISGESKELDVWVEEVGPRASGFSQTVVAITPYDEDGVMLGAGRAEMLSVNVKDGETIGGLVDQGDGVYVQVIEYRSSAVPTVTLSIGGTMLEPFLVEYRESGEESGFKNLAFVLGTLLAVSLIVIGFLVRRNLKSGGMPSQ